MSEFLSFKNVIDDFEVEFEVIAPISLPSILDERQLKIMKELESLDHQIVSNQKKIDELNVGIDKLTNHADGIDYMVAVASGILSGFIDSFFVGEFNMNSGSEKVNNYVKDKAKNQKINDKVNDAIKNAKSKGKVLDEQTINKIKSNVGSEFDTSHDGDSSEGLKKAIKFFENKYGLPGDDVFTEAGRGISPSSHHLDDLAHHPTLLGLLCSVVMQFSGKGLYQNKNGESKLYVVKDEFIGADMPSKFFAGTINWFWHLVSDMAGSSSTPGAGMGIPGPIMSMVKEFSMIPGINKTPLPKLVGSIFEDNRFDFRSELTFASELGKQAIPVVINETLVRTFYFIRRLGMEIKEKQSFKEIEWKKTLPFKNRTIIRMLTISTGVFTAFDMVDAAIRAAIKSGGFGPKFLSDFVLSVNFVGVGRFAIACTSDLSMGVKKSKLRNERMQTYTEQLFLLDAKVYYKQADMWVSAESAGESIEEAYKMIKTTTEIFIESLKETNEDINKIGMHAEEAEHKNPGLMESLDNILEWG